MHANLNDLIVIKNAIVCTISAVAPVLPVAVVHPLHWRIELFVIKAQFGNALVTELVAFAQWALDGDPAVTKFMVVENLAGKGFRGFSFWISGWTATAASHLGGFIQINACNFFKSTKAANDGGDIGLAHFIAFAAEGFAHFAVQIDAIDQLHFAFAFVALFIRQYPHVSGDTGVVEHIGGQANNGFHQVSF